MSEITQELREVVTRHGQVVAAGDLKAVLADFRADRVGQLVASALLPDDLIGSEVLRLEPDGACVNAFIRYTAADGAQILLRSKWVQLAEGWRVSAVRNLPDTPADFGTQGPSDSGLDRPHWEGLRAGLLRMQQCTRCARWIWAPRALCPGCHSWELNWPEVDAVGTVYSWTRTWQPFASAVRGHLPYTVVLVSVEQAGGRRLLGALRNADQAELRIGQRVKGEVEPGAEPGAWPLLRWALS